MNENSRTKNVFLNVSVGYIAQIGLLILSFVGRKIFLHYLSADYLGINGLYTNILTIISLPELGLDTAVVYSLYKPVADHDVRMTASLISYFKKIYLGLTFGIFGIGLLLIPFLNLIITSDLPYWDLAIYYILFLINTVSSYLVAHKSALLSASQEQRVHKVVTLTSTFLLQFIHICVLVIWKNYYLYLAATVTTTILSNIVLGRLCTGRHKDVFAVKDYVDFDKSAIIKRVKATFLYKIGTVLINSTDNILISVLVSTIAVGYYSNYCTLTLSVQGFIAIVTTSLLSGIGNFAAKEDSQKQVRLFDTMLLCYHLLGATGLIGFSLLSNEFITMWLGEEYVLDSLTVFIIAFNFYITNAISPIWMFREANGLFEKVKYLLLIRAAANILFSVLFGIIWGTFGILLATAVSLILTGFWYEPMVLFRTVMHTPAVHYWKKQGKYFLAAMAAFAASYFSIRLIGGTSVLCFIIKAIMIVGFSGSAFLLVSFKTPEFKNLTQLLIKRSKK